MEIKRYKRRETRTGRELGARRVRGDAVVFSVPDLDCGEQGCPFRLVTLDGIPSPGMREHGDRAFRLRGAQQVERGPSGTEEGNILAPHGGVHDVVTVLVFDTGDERDVIRARLCAGLSVINPALRAEACLLYTSDAADDLLCVDLGGRRIIK